MKKRSTALILASLFLLSFLFIAGCGSSSPIVMEQFGGVSDIPEGEEAFIYWTFANADFVKVEGNAKQYAISDRMTVRPSGTTTYRVTAMRNDDSLSQEWTVNVYRTSKHQQNGTDQAGGSQSSAKYDTSLVSRYFHGGSAQPSAIPAQLKIIRFSPFSLDEKSLEAKALVFDKAGSFIPERIREGSEGDWYVRYSCSEVSEEHKAISIIERTGNIPTPAVSFMLDRSFSMEEYGSAIFQDIRSYFNEMPNNSKCAFAVFNQTISPQFSLTNSDSASIKADFLSIPSPGGLSALFRATDFAINTVENSKGTNNIAVIITAGVDNASVLYTAEDVISHARLANVPLYIIALGEAPQLYVLRNLAMKSGGRLYHLSAENIADLPAVLREIVEGQTSYYDLTLPSPGNTQSCETVTSTIALPSNGTTLNDKLIIYDRRIIDAPMYQSIVLFTDDDADIPDEYKSTIKQIAATLRSNPDKKIELSGHSSLSNSETDAVALADRRAQSVKRLLVTEGIAASRIFIRNMSNHKPAYYFEDTKWQAISNRRVDIRWLDPSLLPYEIAAQRVATEDEAIHFVQEWEQRGLKSYYERTMVKRTPMYSVKLWGYSTAEESENAAKFLAKQYKTELRAE